ncbi:adenylyltransferase and sulfurtransferase MOCS3-like [Halichondria panicea]|uniref:adenylyltransferase and sulfurtransferase MOCS3-like n=1 Tax=Halichondria panicea TaxID=6063 RepID=UPI00312B74EB
MDGSSDCSAKLSKEEIGRYGRQLILPEWGVKSQLLLKSTSVLIVGVGGLGCPAALHLAAAGVGHVGLLDYDSVELSNLHRQVLHTEQRVGVQKAESAKLSIHSLNSSVQVSTHCCLLSRTNALDLLKSYDVILDCTDNVATRYLLNDACVLLQKPLVSGSALRFEGQLTVYGYKGGPCYRCLFPTPPPPHTVTNCSEGGVLGAVPGVIGTMQATEAIKIATQIGNPLSGRLLMYDALMCTFRTIKLRPQQPQCVVCGENPSIKELIDYELFCGSRADDKSCHVSILRDEERMSCKEYMGVVKSSRTHLLLDVREPVEFEICHLPKSLNYPLRSLESDPVSNCRERLSWILEQQSLGDPVLVCVVCRRGNDSQLAVRKLKDQSDSLFGAVAVEIKDIVGGLTEWSNTIDQTFPKY